MELEVGMYVRTLKGIAKIVGRELKPDNYYFQCWITDRFLCICDDTEYLCDSDILKASNNILALIEVGDIINKKEVVKIIHFEGDTFYRIELFGGKAIMNSRDIKSIVTKEMYERIEYKIGG